jgi:ankyrin repeat protein
MELILKLLYMMDLIKDIHLFYAAARNYNLEIIKYLVSKGVNVEAKLLVGNSNNTLLSLIISNKWTFLYFNENPCNVLGKKSEIIKLLLINGAEINNINIEAITEPNIKDLDKTQSQEIITEQELARTCNHKFAIKLFKNLLIKTGIPGDYASYNKLLEQKYSGKISDDLLKKLKNTIKGES